MGLYFLIGFLGILSLIITYIIKQIAVKRRLVHAPNDRSLHDVPIPRIGGLAIVSTWYLGISVLFLLKVIEQNLYYALMSGVLIAVVSFIDDIIDIKPTIRLIVQFTAAIIAFYFIDGLRPFIIPGFEVDYTFITYPLAIIGMVWFINLFNFMDGVDGFASIEAIIISVVLLIYSSDIINLLLIACISGFLFWNLPKAKIFMGDIGSTQLGFVLIVLGIYFHNTYSFSILNWIMLSSPFWFDATFTLYRRWRNREKLSQAHRKHAYQRIVRAGYSHGMADLFLVLINLIIILMIFLYRKLVITQIPMYLLCLLFLYLITKIVDKKLPFDSK